MAFAGPQPASLRMSQLFASSRSLAFALGAMGCAGSCESPGEPCGAGIVFNIPEEFAKPSRGMLPPDSHTHLMYFSELNAYLVNVAKHPRAFRKIVERRWEEDPGTTMKGLELSFCDQTGWLSIGVKVMAVSVCGAMKPVA